MLEETKNKIRRTMTGRKYTKKRKRNMSKARKGQLPTKETKDKISASLKGKTKGIKRGPRSKESIEKQSKFCKRRIPWKKGQPFTDEMKAQMTEQQIMRRMKYITRGL